MDKQDKCIDEQVQIIVKNFEHKLFFPRFASNNSKKMKTRENRSQITNNLPLMAEIVIVFDSSFAHRVYYSL